MRRSRTTAHLDAARTLFGRAAAGSLEAALAAETFGARRLCSAASDCCAS